MVRKKILFGSDSPWASQKDFLDYFNQFPLSETEKENVLSLNAKKLLKDCM